MVKQIKSKWMACLLIVTVLMGCFGIEIQPIQAQADEKEELLPGGVQPLEVHQMSLEEAEKIKAYVPSKFSVKAVTKNSYGGTYGYEKIENVRTQTIYKKLQQASKDFQLSEQNAQEITNTDGSTSYIAFKISLEKNTYTEKELEDAVLNFIYDNPQYFWTLGYTYYINSSGYVTAVALACDSAQKEGSVRRKLWDVMEKNIQEYLDKVSGLATDYEKELTLHDELAKQLTYAYRSGRVPESARWAHSIVGAFDNEHYKVVCEGYSKAFYLLLNAAGIKSNYVVGDGITGNSKEGHAWNQVQIENEWYNVDLTWNDTNNLGSHKYFNVPDEVFLKNHHPYDQSESYVGSWCYVTEKCSAVKYSYSEKGAIAETDPVQLVSNISNNAIFKLYNQGVEVASQGAVGRGTCLEAEISFKNPSVYYDVTTQMNGQKYVENCVSGGAVLTYPIIADKEKIEISVESISIPVTKVSLEQQELELYLGEDTGMLKVSLEPENATNQRIFWETSDEQVATVSGGAVLPVSEGRCVVSAYSEDGLHRADCTVYIRQRVNIVFDPDNGTEPVSVTAVSGAGITLPRSPQKKGYIFEGWYDEKGNKITEATVIKESKTFQAKWSKDKQVLEKISISKSISIYKGKESKISVSLPEEIYQVEEFSTDSQEEKCQVKLGFSSENPSAVSVNKKTGKITAKKGNSTANIFTTIYFADGTEQIFTTKVTVKQPKLVISVSKATIKKGKTITFRVKKYGITGNVIWKVSNSRAVINKKTGKFRAKKKGCVYVTVKAGSYQAKKKITIKK